jgi:3-deoxy-D-manno-octulosonic-acid transferase
MLKLLEILQSIYLDKLIFKSTEYKAGFNKAIDIVKLHGFKTEIIQETKQLREEVLQSEKDKEFLKSRLELKKEEVSVLTTKNGRLRNEIQTRTIADSKKSIKRLKNIKKIVTCSTRTSDEKVYGVLAYIKAIKENREDNEPN